MHVEVVLLIEKSVEAEAASDDVTAGGCTCCAPDTSPVKVMLKLGACVLAGMVFGFCFEKSRGQFIFFVIICFCDNLNPQDN